MSNFIKTYKFESVSPFNGAPIVGHLVWSTENPKTGPGWQLAILDRDTHPHQAIKEGKDVSVCGKCPLRNSNPVTGQRACYVTTMALGQMFKKTADRQANPDKVPASQYTRLGMYGDPAMLPFDVVNLVAKAAKKHSGYTHQWREKWYDKRFDGLVMRSVETLEQAQACWGEGARTFRVDLEGIGPQPGEAVCPNEVDRFITCSRCGLCNGVGENGERANIKSIVITPHGGAFKGSESKKKLTALRVLEGAN